MHQRRIAHVVRLVLFLALATGSIFATPTHAQEDGPDSNSHYPQYRKTCYEPRGSIWNG